MMRKSVGRWLGAGLVGVLLGLSATTSTSALPEESRPFDRFDADTVGNDWENAYLLSYLSHYVYERELDPTDEAGSFGDFSASFREHFSALGLSNISTIEIGYTDTQAIVAETADAVIVAFRGTSTLADAAVDALVNGTPSGIHLGFAWAASSSLEAIYERVADATHRGKKLWLTGHSLGGALAQVTGLFLATGISESCILLACAEFPTGYEQIVADGIITFGSPRPFTLVPFAAEVAFVSQFAPPFEDPDTWRAQRWVNNLDPVPHVPPVGYNDAGKLHLIEVTHRDGGYQNSTCALTSPWPHLILLPDVGDHDTKRYANRILGLMPAELRPGLPEPPAHTPVAACDDGTPPIMTVAVDGTPASGYDGWYSSDVTVSWTVSDPQSPLETECPPTVISNDTTSDGQVVACTATSGGGSTTQSVTIRRDTSPAAVSPNPTGPLGSNGWYVGDVTVGWSATDPHSPVTGCPTNTQTSDTVGTTFSCTASSAGGSTTATIQVRRDSTPPTITCPTPTPQFEIGGTAQLVASAGDATSGALDGTGSTWQIAVQIDPAELTSVGPRTLPVSAADRAGNQASISCNYSVVYLVKHSEDDTVLVGDVVPASSGEVNTLPAGKPVRIEFDLGGDRGLQVIASGYPKSSPSSCLAGASDDPVESVEMLGNQTLQYDAATGHYMFPWKTDPQWKGTCRQLVLRLADGNEYTANFKFL